MRKSDIIKRIPKKLPDHSIAKIIRSGKQRGLMLILPEWRKNCPKRDYYSAKTGIVHVTWDTGYLTYYIKDKCWTNEGIGWIEWKSELTADNFDLKSEQTIAKFTGRYGTIPSIESYEQDVAWRKKVKYQHNKKRRIADILKIYSSTRSSKMDTSKEALG